MDIIVGGIPLIIVIFGMVEFLKKFKVTGNALTIASLAIGLVLGVFYKASLEYTLINKYFEWGVFGLACGLAACGLFDFANARLPKKA